MLKLRSFGRLRSIGVGLAAALIVAGCASTTASHPSTTSGGTVTFAEQADAPPNYIFPLMSGNYFDHNNLPFFDYLMYRPLYWFGGTSNGTAAINESLSLAQLPTFSQNNTVATITLKHWNWSDGKPVTARDIVFWMNLLSAATDPGAPSVGSSTSPGPGWGAGVPGGFPENVVSYQATGTYSVVFHLNASYNPTWFLYNELSQITPLPQQSWDRLSTSGSVGNYDTAAQARMLAPASDGLPANSYVTADPGTASSGALGVAQFLNSQSEDLSTYSSNPLWQVVDGPWKLQSYDPTTARTVFERNNAFTGPDKPKLSGDVLESFSSQPAEVDALRNGSLDYGYLPLSDVKLSSTFKADGYTIAPWATDYVQWAELGYTSKTWGPLVKQLYIRQALQHVINEPLYLSATLHGDGQLTYGPVPNLPGSPYVSPQEKTDPDPYSVSAAKALLTAHGWTTGSNGVMVCSDPGTGATQCGAGIAKSEPLSLKFMYQTGTPTLQAQVEAFATAAKSAGMDLVLDPQSQSTMFSIGGVCPSSGPCNWGIILYRTFLWNYGQGDVLPTGGQMFGAGNYWGGGYSSSTAQTLINDTHTQAGLQPLFNYENYISTHVAALWFPTWDWQVSVVSNHLHGWDPQQVFGDPVPSRWYF